MEEELKEYEKKKNELKGAIKANNFKLDDDYKNELTLRAKTVAESVKVGAQLMMIGGKREKKKQEKAKKTVASDLDNFCLVPKVGMTSEVGAKREGV